MLRECFDSVGVLSGKASGLMQQFPHVPQEVSLIKSDQAKTVVTTKKGHLNKNCHYNTVI